MRGFSKAIIAGNVVRDPELKSLPSGTSVCNFTIAVNRVYRDSSGMQQEAVSYIDCAVWGKPTEVIMQYVRKGSGLLVSGRLDQRSWEDKATGQKRYRMEVVVEDFTLIGGRNDGGGQGGYGAGNNNYTPNNNFGANNNSAGNNTVGDAKGAAEPQSMGGEEVVPTDIPEDPINLDELPF